MIPDTKVVKTPKVAVIGCGNIGSRWDETARQDAVLTHAGAWHRLQALTALADMDPERLATAGRFWGVTALYADYRALLAEVRPDIVSIATPTGLRLPLVEAALASGARAILLEKPIALTLDEALAIKAVCGTEVVVAVNYLRRYDPTLQALAAQIHAGRLGTIQHVVGRYGKGIVENGSHWIDLIQWWFGAVQRVRVLRRLPDDRPDHDPTLDAVLEIGGAVPIYLLAVDHRHYSLFEMDIVGTKGRVTLTKRGSRLQHWEAEPDALFPGYRVLQLEGDLHADLGLGLLRAAKDLLAVWRGEQIKPSCTLEDGIAALRTVLALRETAQGEKSELS